MLGSWALVARFPREAPPGQPRAHGLCALLRRLRRTQTDLTSRSPTPVRRNGLIEVLQVAAYACSGHLTKADYKKILADVEDRYTRHKKLRCYTEVANDFNGLDPGALWEDAKLGFAHMFDWDRFAVVTDVEWISRTTKFMAMFLPLEGRVYPMADAERAREWISET